MALSMNRYIGNSILPLLIKHSKFYNEAENYASLLDATLHTVYRLSKNRMLTKGQREAVSDFLVALTSQMQPAMLLKLLRKLTVDVSRLSEYTTVALRVSYYKNLHYNYHYPTDWLTLTLIYSYLHCITNGVLNITALAKDKLHTVLLRMKRNV